MVAINKVLRRVSLVAAFGIILMMNARTSHIPVDGDVLEGLKLNGVKYNFNDSVLDLFNAKVSAEFERSVDRENDSIILITEPNLVRRILTRQDSAFLIGEYQRGLRTTGRVPRLIEIPDDRTMQANFYETALSAGTIPVRRSGYVTLHSPTPTTVVTWEGDSLKNCLSYYRETFGPIILPASLPDSIDTFNSAHVAEYDTLQRVSREFSWYSDDSRYPVAELEQHIIYKDSVLVDSISLCSYFSPETLKQLPSYPADEAEILSRPASGNGLVLSNASPGAEIDPVNISVSPTVIEDHLSINLYGNQNDWCTCRIYYNDGKVIYEGSGNNQSINCSSWHPGTYLVVLSLGGDIHTYKLLKR